MAALYKTPGVYVEEIVKFPPSIAPVETAIPAFIGYTEKAKEQVDDDLYLKPKRISSMVEYEAYFGGADKEKGITVAMTKDEDGNEHAVAKIANRSPHIMYYALQLFFANGGGPCYIVSVGDYSSSTIDKNNLTSGLNTLEKEDEPTLIIFPEAQSLLILDFNTLHDYALGQCHTLKDRFVIMDMHGIDVGIFRSEGLGSDNLKLKYGAVYYPNIETTLDFSYDETVIDVTFPAPPSEGEESESSSTETKKMNALKQENNRRYELAKAAIRDMPCIMPSAAAIAGIYASVDNSRGVWKAPANVSLMRVIRPVVQISNAEQDEMNEDSTGKSINAIRSFTGKGTLVWGARTLAGNDNEWRYINVRRFFNFAEESIKKATEQFVFEPNDANTWVRVQAMIENFLTTQWRQGALQGVKPEHAFYVAVGLGKTMTALDIQEGRMIIEIGMAVVRPAEFIILKFSHKMAES